MNTAGKGVHPFSFFLLPLPRISAEKNATCRERTVQALPVRVFSWPLRTCWYAYLFFPWRGGGGWFGFVAETDETN